MNKQNLTIFGRELELDIVYDCYTGEEVLPKQREALEKFLPVAESLVNGAEEKLEEYCLDKNKDDIGSTSIDNIFKFVMPQQIYIQRSVDSNVIGLLCKYKFNMEDGIAIVFRDEKFDKIGTQDIIL
jgi:hypothetical protein